MFNNCVLAIPTTENASFNSKKSTSLISILAQANALLIAKAGAVVNHSGACAASANANIFANGFKPNSFTLSPLINTNALAPSFKVEALAAVTVPSFSKTGFKVLTLSKFTLVNSSSVETKIASLPR